MLAGYTSEARSSVTKAALQAVYSSTEEALRDAVPVMHSYV